MADRDTTFRLVVDDQGTPVLKAFGTEASKVLGIEKELALAGGQTGQELAGGATSGSAAMALYKRAVGGGTVSLAEMKAATQALNREMDQAATPEDRARFAALAREVEHTEKATRQAAQAFGTAEKEVASFGRGAQAGQTALGQFGQAGQMALGVMGGNALGVAAEGLALGVAHVVRSNMELSSTVSDLSAITGVAGDDLNRLRDAGIDLSISSGRAATDSIDAYKLLASNIDIASIGGVEGLKTLGQEVVTLSLAARVDLATAANATANTLNQFGLSASESSRIVNVLAAGAKYGAAEVGDLSEALRNSGTAAAGANLTVEETVGALEVLAQNAQKGSEAGTGLQSVITTLQTKTDVLAKNGIKGVNIEGEGLNATLRRLAPLVNDATALAEVFGQENIKTARILINGAAAVESMTDAVTGTNTAAEQAAVQMDNLAGDVDKMIAAANALALEGGEVNDELRDMAQWTTEVLVGVRALTNGTQELGGMMSGLADGLGVFQSVASKLNILKDLMDGIRNAGIRQQITDDAATLAERLRPAAFRGGGPVVAPAEPPPPPRVPPGSTTTPKKTPAQREAERLQHEQEREATRLQNERERNALQQRRDDERAAADSVALRQKTADDRTSITIAEAGHAEALRQLDARAEARAVADRFARFTDEFHRRGAILDDAAKRRTADYDAQVAEAERVAQAERQAIDITYNREDDRIKNARKEKGLSAAETRRLDDQLALAAAARDRSTTETENRRALAARRALEQRRDGESEEAAARRQLADDEAARDHQRFAERGEQVNREMERAVAAVRAERDAKEKAHREQMQRVQEESDATLAAIGLAAQMMATVTANRRAALDAEYAEQTHRREAAQDAELAAMQARVDAERGVVDERTALEKQLDAAKVLVEKRRAADDLAYRKKSAEMDRKQAVADRAANLFRIAIETALNVVKAFPNPFKIAAAAALGVSQGVAVAGQPLPAIPQYALGTDRAPGGLALVGERGPELVHIPGGSSVITNERTERLGAAMRAVEQSQRATGAAQIVVQQVPDPAHAAALVAMRRETAGQTARLEAGLMGVERATREIDLRIDGLELSRGLKRVEAREAAAGNTRTR